MKDSDFRPPEPERAVIATVRADGTVVVSGGADMATVIVGLERALEWARGHGFIAQLRD